MDRRLVSVSIILACVILDSAAEVTRLPIFPPAAAFSASPEAFPSFSSWMLLDHVFNQNDTPNAAHSFDAGSIFTLYADRRVAVTALARELFQFKPSPDGPYNFWARAIVTDLRLTAQVKLTPFIAGVGYRHDCKHDIGNNRREVIHDAVFLQLLRPPSPTPFLGSALNSSLAFSLEAEVNTPLIFQAGEEESDRARFSLECGLVPFETASGLLRTILDARVSLLNREMSDRPVVEERWNVDWLIRAGTEFRSAQGGVRLTYSLERLTDDWATLEPSPVTISAVTLLVFFNSASR